MSLGPVNVGDTVAVTTRYPLPRDTARPGVRALIVAKVARSYGYATPDGKLTDDGKLPYNGVRFRLTDGFVDQGANRRGEEYAVTHRLQVRWDAVDDALRLIASRGLRITTPSGHGQVNDDIILTFADVLDRQPALTNKN